MAKLGLPPSAASARDPLPFLDVLQVGEAFDLRFSPFCYAVHAGRKSSKVTSQQLETVYRICTQA